MQLKEGKGGNAQIVGHLMILSIIFIVFWIPHYLGFSFYMLEFQLGFSCIFIELWFSLESREYPILLTGMQPQLIFLDCPGLVAGYIRHFEYHVL